MVKFSIKSACDNPLLALFSMDSNFAYQVNIAISINITRYNVMSSKPVVKQNLFLPAVSNIGKNIPTGRMERGVLCHHILPDRL
jgi:hypothetical protein